MDDARATSGEVIYLCVCGDLVLSGGAAQCPQGAAVCMLGEFLGIIRVIMGKVMSGRAG